jgi:hypothetical protein
MYFFPGLLDFCALSIAWYSKITAEFILFTNKLKDDHHNALLPNEENESLYIFDEVWFYRQICRIHLF